MKNILKVGAILLLAVLCIFLLPLENNANADIFSEIAESIQDHPYGLYHAGDVKAINDIKKNLINSGEMEIWEAGQPMPKWWTWRTKWYEDENGVFRLYELNFDDVQGDLDLTKVEKLAFLKVRTSTLYSINASDLKKLSVLQIFSNNAPALSYLNVQGSENMKILRCNNQKLKTLDLRGFKKLEELECYNNELTELKLAGCVGLKTLECAGNKLQYLNYNFPELWSLDCSANKLTTLNLTASKHLEKLYCRENQLVSLNISGLADLEILSCWGNQLSSLNISGMEKLETLSCGSNNLSGALDLSKFKKLSGIGIDENEITELKLPVPDIVKFLSCSDNQLTELPDVANRWELQTLACGGNKINYLDLSGLPWLWTLECNDNGLETLNVENSSHLRWLDCSGNRLKELDLSENYRLIELDCSGNNITKVILNDEAPYKYLNVSYNNMKDYSDIQGKSMIWDKPSINQYYFTPQKILISKPGDISITFPLNPGENIPITIHQKPVTIIPSMPGKSTLIEYPLGLSGNKGSSLNDAYQAYLKERNKELGISDVTLTFNTMGGNKIDSISELPGTMIDLFEYMPTRDSHIFYGWYEDTGYTKQINFIKLDENRTVYAKWDTLMAPVQTGQTSFYESASEWAIPELEKAYDADLIPEMLKGLDMKKSISREEFAELAVQLYEKSTGKAILVTKANPFTDTSNGQILKAYQAGITAGTSDTTFSPDTLISREQCATMLYRAIKAIAPNADYGIAGIEDFPDQAHISTWAIEGTKYMSKLGIILGNTQGEFMPKPLTKDQENSGYGMAAREAAVLMTIRTFEKIK